MDGIRKQTGFLLPAVEFIIGIGASCKAAALIALAALVSASAWASPLPSGMGIENPLAGVYRSQLGFQLSVKGTNWQQSAAPKNARYILTLFRPPITPPAGPLARAGHTVNSQASMTVRVDKVNGKPSLKAYMDQWLKDYPKFGFDVLGSKPFSNNGVEGYVIDLMSAASRKQLRQAVYLKGAHAVILTCRDSQDHFKDTLKPCNSIIRSFQWEKSSAEKTKL